MTIPADPLVHTVIPALPVRSMLASRYPSGTLHRRTAAVAFTGSLVPHGVHFSFGALVLNRRDAEGAEEKELKTLWLALWPPCSLW